MILYNLKFPINQEEEDDEDNCELLEELVILLKQEDKMIQPPKEPVDMINLGTEEDKKKVNVDASLNKYVKKRLVELLHECVDVFARLYQDMPELGMDIIMHKLSLKPECPSVKQKLRRTRSDMSLKIREKVRKQFNAGFLVVVKYPQWVTDIVPIHKKDGKLRMCMDYRDLNK